MQGQVQKGGNWRFSWKKTGEVYEFYTYARFYPLFLAAFCAYLFSAVMMREALLIAGSIIPLVLLKAFIQPGLLPALIVNREGIKLKKTEINWGGLLSVITLPSRGKGRLLRLSFRKKADGPVETGDMLVGEGKAGQWLINMLKKGAKGSAAVRAHMIKRLEASYEFGTMTEYRGWKLSEEGMKRGMKRIPWASIKGLSTEARDNALVILYEGKAGLEKLSIADKKKFTRRRFMKLVLRALPRLEVDAALMNSIGEKKKAGDAIDAWASVLVIISLILAVVGSMMVGTYTFDIKESVSSYLYAPFIAWVVFLLAGLVGMVGKQGDKVKSTRAARRMGWLCMAAVPVGMGAFFALYPGAGTWLQADTHRMMGDYERAHEKYEECLVYSPGSKYLLFDLGMNSHSMERWEDTIEYFEKGYEADPRFWQAGHVMHAPDALIQLGRGDEAREYCLMHYERYPGILTDCDDLPSKMEEFRKLGFSPTKVTFVNMMKGALDAGKKKQEQSKEPQGPDEG